MLKNLTIPMPDAAGPLQSRPARSRLPRVGDASATVSLWLNRSRSRRALATLDDRDLNDIGLTAAEASRESEKPFWRA